MNISRAAPRCKHGICASTCAICRESVASTPPVEAAPRARRDLDAEQRRKELAEHPATRPQRVFTQAALRKAITAHYERGEATREPVPLTEDAPGLAVEPPETDAARIATALEPPPSVLPEDAPETPCALVELAPVVARERRPTVAKTTAPAGHWPVSVRRFLLRTEGVYLTLSLNGSMLELERKDREFVHELLKRLEDYEEEAADARARD